MDFRMRWEREEAMISRLVERFKPLFPDPTKPNISVPLGWEAVLAETFEKLAGNRNGDKDLQILQVKDKFANLRIYTNFSSERIVRIIAEAEARMDGVCMSCGLEDEEVTNQPSFQILCKKCAEEYRKTNPDNSDSDD
jgi:hypothetical protein